MLLFLIVGVLAVILDMLTKYFAITVFRLCEIEIIKDILYFTYLENTGAAFGIFKNQRAFFIVVTILVVLAILLYIILKKPSNKLLLISLGAIAGGGVGNLIDRIRFSYVVDFIDIRIINYPVFNIADCFVVIGAILFIIYTIFFSDKEEKQWKK